jgi:hypothetical protein
MSLSDLISLTITKQTTAPTQAGFGRPCLVGYHTAWIDGRIRLYSEAAEMLDDGFTVDDELYKMAVSLKSQNPSPPDFYVGRRASAPTRTVHIIPTVTTEGHVTSGTVNGTEVSHTNGAAETIATIVAALQTLIDAISGVTATVPVGDTHVEVVVDVAGDDLSVSFDESVNLLDETADPGITADLNAVRAEQSDWYGLAIDSSSQAEIEATATWAEAEVVLFVPRSADWDVKDASEEDDVATTTNDSNYARTVGIWHKDSIGVEFPDCAWMGRMLPTIPGSATWAFKTLAGVPVSDLSQGEENAIRGKHWSTYTDVAGVGITYEGHTGAGDYADITRFVDKIRARLEERTVFIFANNDKIPFTDAGVDSFRGEYLNVLGQGVIDGGFTDDPAPTVTFPRVADISAINKASRTLPDGKFGAVLAGAIHNLRLDGTVRV